MTQDEVYQLQRNAISAVQAAIKAGNLPRARTKKCVDCGAKANGYDHRDYYKPLEVEPVCRSCNHKRGPAHPIPSDWYEYNGHRWDNLNDGDGIEYEFSGRLIIDIDIRAIEMEIEKVRNQRDRDEITATLMLGSMPAKFRDGTMHKPNRKDLHNPFKWHSGISAKFKLHPIYFTKQRTKVAA